jgi:fucose permease
MKGKGKNKRETLDSLITKSVNSDDDDSTISQYLIAEKPYRYIVLAICSLLNFANGFGRTNISSISSDFQKSYEMTSTQTYLFTNIYFYVFIIMSIPSVFILERHSLKMAV